jgi:hypothetical protein
MKASDVPRAVSAAESIASAAGLTVDEAVILNDSNKIAVRVRPCDVVARVARAREHVAPFEVDLAQRLAGSAGPVAALDPRVEPRVYECDGFAITLWTYYEPMTSHEVAPADYADALLRLHDCMRTVDICSPHFTDRVAEARQFAASPAESPALTDADRELLLATSTTMERAIADRGATEQLLHGEPHPGNLLDTKDGLLFIDLETCCRGPVEFDLAHVPEAVSASYPDVDRELLDDCRGLVLAMVAGWRLDPRDRFPDGQRALRELLRALREGPPWPTLDVVMGRPDLPDSK